MTVPLYQVKAQLFRTLGHPVRIRVLELLLDGPKAVHELLTELPMGSAKLSQQLAVLRGTGVVSARRDGNTVEYSLSTTDVGDLLRAVRLVLTQHAVGQGKLLAELRMETAS